MTRRWLQMRRFVREHKWTSVHVNDYLDGDLAPAERERVETHVGLCPECRRLLQALRATLEGLMGLRTNAPVDLKAGIVERLRQEPQGP